MSDSHYSYPREKTLKFFGKRTGWYGEQCWAQEGLKFIKRMVKRSNRRWEKKQLINELNQMEDCMYAAFVYPDTDECAAFLQFDLDRAAERRKEDDIRMKQVYEFNNDLIRKRLK